MPELAERNNYNAMHRDTKFRRNPEDDNILECDDKGDGEFETLFSIPKGKKLFFEMERNPIWKLEYRVSTVFINCPECGKKTNYYGHCTAPIGQCNYF